VNCIHSLSRLPIPGDIFIQTLKLYYQMGRNEEYERLFGPNDEVIGQQVAGADAMAFFRLFFAEYKVPESRLRTLQLSSTVAKNKGETQYKNIVTIFQMIHSRSAQPFHLNVTEVNDLVKLLFAGVYPADKFQYRKMDNKKKTLISQEGSSLREQLETLIELTGEGKKHGNYEPLFLHLNFMVDFLNMEIYRYLPGDVIAVLVYYLLSMQDGMISFSYLSFFNKLLLNKDEFKAALEKTRFGWSEGYSEIMPLERFYLRIYHELYIDLQEYARDYDYEKNLEISKSDYIENTIDKLPEVFQKEDIRTRHPFISDSTINRTLSRMQSENKIRPLGKGRSAKWVKLYKKETGKFKGKQLTFDLEE